MERIRSFRKEKSISDLQDTTHGAEQDNPIKRISQDFVNAFQNEEEFQGP